MQGNPISSAGQVFTLFMSGKEALPLRAGEIVTAEVLHNGADNNAMIRVKNAVLEVRSDIPLQKGDTLSLRVEQQENTIYLRLAGNAAESVDSIKSTVLSILSGFGKIAPGAEGMARLIDLLKMVPAPLKENLPEIDIVNQFLVRIEQLTGKTLQDAVWNGGVFFESKLRLLALGMEADAAAVDSEAGRIITNDLKASLLRLKETLLSPEILGRIKDLIRPEELINALNAVLRNIEFHQLQSKLTDSLQFFLPLVWEQLKDGELILRESDRGKPGERSYSCTINLELERAGKLRVNLLFQEGRVHVNFAAENDHFSRLLQDNAGALEQQFSASGLRIGKLSVHHQQRIDFNDSHAEGLSIRV